MLKTNLHAAENFSDSQFTKLLNCLELIEKAVNSDEFKQAVLGFSHAPTYTTGKMWWKKTVVGKPVNHFFFEVGEQFYSNQQVYDRVMSGWEEGEPTSDHEMDIYIGLARSRWSSATAYGYAGDDRITIYTWWFNSALIPQLCNTIFHEWLHNQMFEHDFNWNVCRDFSVPYALGQILENIISKKLESGEYRV
jgi:hypothetical protein